MLVKFRTDQPMPRPSKSSTSQTLLDKALGFTKPYWDRIARVVKRVVDDPPKKALLTVTVILYLVVQAYVTFPSFGQGYPARDDDAYGYMLKAAQIKAGCFLQDCPALTDLRAQIIEPANDPEVAAYRNRIYHRLFVVYHPLHSFVLAGLSSLGIDFETGYDLIYALAKILLPLAVAYWLVSTWGVWPAITALLLLTPTLFGGSGLHIIKMHTHVLILSLFLWAEIYRGTNRAGSLLVLITVLMSLQHPLGKILSLVSIALYAVLAEWPLGNNQKIVLATSSLVLVAFFSAPSFINRPELGFDPIIFYPGNWDYLSDFSTNFADIIAGISSWLNSFGSPLLFLPVALFGFLTLQDRERRKIAVVAVMLFAIFVVGLIYVVPWYGAISFSRVWPLITIFLTGVFAVGLNFLIRIVYTYIPDLKISRPTKFSDRGQNQAGNWFIKIQVLGLAVLILFSLTSYFSKHLSSYFSYADSEALEGQFINREQLARISSTSETRGTDETILYMDEYALEYYLTYGGLDYGAVYYTPLRNTPDLDVWLTNRAAEISYAVNRNPIFRMPHTPDGCVDLMPDSSLEIASKELVNAGDIAFLIGEHSEDLVLKILYGDENKDSYTLRLAAGSTEWISVPANVSSNPSFTIFVPADRNPAHICGLRVDDNNGTLWPWDQEITLTYQQAEENVVITLNSAVIVSPRAFDLTVLDDRGFLILAKVNH